MDARPQRLRVHAVGNENTIPSKHDSLHQRHKSTGNLQAMPRNGALQVAAKRNAFGDVSNTAKNLATLPSDQIPGKGKAVDFVYNKENAVNGKDGFSKAAQRATALSNKNGPVAAEWKQPRTQNKQVAKRSSAAQLYEARPSKSKFVAQDPITESTSARQPRHHKSQPQLKNEPAAHVLRRTQSKLSTASAHPAPAAPNSKPMDDVTEAAYEDAVEHIGDEHYHGTYHRRSLDVTNNDLPEDFASADAAVDKLGSLEPLSESLGVPNLSEPEEYWDEDDEEELYDDQGYTTAHSYRSRGDLTTGGVTTILAPKITDKVEQELETARAIVESTRTQEEVDDEIWDVCMVAEYGDEIFEYMRELEMRMLPDPHYMDNQAEIQWSMRSVLMDWLVQVHHRFSLLPETLFLTVNYIDRFLSYKVVSIGKLQLVGATALLVASKYEEINCPSLQEIVFMVDNGYKVDEILKAERFMLSMLSFELGFPGPMSFLRRVSKADDYDLETRTLAKYFLEVTIMDERFVASPPSFLAAAAHCLSRLILKKGDWTPAHVHYSGYTWGQLKNLVTMILECCYTPRKHHLAVFEKYSDKRYKRAAEYVETEIAKGFTLPAVRQSTGRATAYDFAEVDSNAGQPHHAKAMVELQS
ncbi:cyclin domain-containing protein [Colletotrichum orchidophilum]|uniref:Cyclin domain-containing protein n=1 Tax=Colletotrichum orchidophilum TaxID=1209926 RepID=A0A1G4AVX9_9PEZI|nr:cyclin domain-containing protein [Colletotrichum orchidophilum]OHE93212.1 cyclin domain-containing protein [Colletotrichum orchidophilum]